MSTAAAPVQATKNLGLSKRSTEEKQADIAKALTAAQHVIVKSNVPTKIYPQAVKPEPTHAPIKDTKETVTTVEAPLPTTQKQARGQRPAPVRRYSVDLPLYVIKEIHQLAFDERTTKKQVILKALQAGGINVKDIDINEHGEVVKGALHG